MAVVCGGRRCGKNFSFYLKYVLGYDIDKIKSLTKEELGKLEEDYYVWYNDKRKGSD